MTECRARNQRRTQALTTTICALLATILVVEPLLAGPLPLSHDNGRKRGAQDGAGGGNLIAGNGGAAVQVPAVASFVEAFALSKSGIENCQPIEGVEPPTGPNGECALLPGGIAHAAAGCGARNAGFCTINLRGVEPGSQLVLARLYLMLVLTEELTDPQISIGVNGHAVTAQLLSSADPPCWTGADQARSVLYAADIANLAPSLINGDFQISGLPSTLTNGASPFLDHSDAPPLAQGAGLVVAYSHAKIPVESVAYIHEDRMGVPILITDLTIDNPLSLPTPEAGTVRLTTIGADGQGSDVGALLPIDTFFSVDGFPVQLRGTGSAVDLRPDWTGNEGGSFTRLFDVRTTEFSGANGTLPTGTNGYSVSYLPQPPATGGELTTPAQKNDPSYSYDCVNVGVHVLTVCGPSLPPL